VNAVSCVRLTRATLEPSATPAVIVRCGDDFAVCIPLVKGVSSSFSWAWTHPAGPRAPIAALGTRYFLAQKLQKKVIRAREAH
jgi:hypothetical protein